VGAKTNYFQIPLFKEITTNNVYCYSLCLVNNIVNQKLLNKYSNLNIFNDKTYTQVCVLQFHGIMNFNTVFQLHL